MLAGIKEVLIISTPRDLPRFEELLGTGESWGMRFEYVVQPKPEGLAQAFILGENFLAGGPAALVLGDNIFYAHGFSKLLQETAKRLANGEKGSTIFAYYVNDPKSYGVVEFDTAGKAISLEEKPIPVLITRFPDFIFMMPKCARSLRTLSHLPGAS
jgi:glucose-1-phosphate thymidylyltransferase